METEVRVAEVTDWQGLGKLLDQLGYPQTESEILEGLSAPDSIVFIAISEVEVIGFIALNVRRSFQYIKPIVSIDALVVDENIRSRGIGKALMTRAVEHASQNDALLLELHSNFKREQAHKFYEREGFVATSKYFVRKLS